MKRKTFIKAGLTATLGVGLFPSFSFAKNLDDPSPLSIETVKEFVIAGHKNIVRCKRW